MCVNRRGRSGRFDLEVGRSLENDSFVTWHDATGHIPCRWSHVRTQRIALSTKKGGIEIAGRVHDVALRPQSRNSFEADERSIISIGRSWPFLDRNK